MTPRAWTRRLIEIALGLLIAAAAIWCMQQTVLGQPYARFHRYALTTLDYTTKLDMVKDAKTGVCRLVYVAQNYPGNSRYAVAMSVAYLGEVPCDPAPVPPVSAVK